MRIGFSGSDDYQLQNDPNEAPLTMPPIAQTRAGGVPRIYCLSFIHRLVSATVVKCSISHMVSGQIFPYEERNHTVVVDY